MIVVDSSALIAIARDEPEAETCLSALSRNEHLLLSAATLTEVLIVAARKGLGAPLTDLLQSSGVETAALTERRALLAAAAYRRWGKGFHSARLNYGDCFAYALAREFDCPLLYVGDDFARTDVRSALG